MEPDYSVSEIAELVAECGAAGLENRDILNRYSFEELTHIMNGIGADWMHPVLRDAISALNPSLVPVSLIHDVECYEAQRYGATEADFVASNRRFRRNGCRMANYRYRWYDPRRYCVKAKGWEFSRILQRFGRSAFFGKAGDK